MEKQNCKACGREIREYNVENFHSLCSDCWWKYKDKLDEIEPKTDHGEQKCYECEKDGSVTCFWCGKHSCIDHARPWHPTWKTYICEICYRKRISVVFGIFLPLFAILALILLFIRLNN